jgi:hypothetical protein
MNKIVIAIVVAVIVVVSGIAIWYYYSQEDEKIKLDETSPLDDENATIILNGTFQGTDYTVEGRALVIKSGDNYTLRFEDFNADTGPGLYIYLSTDKTDNDFIDLGEIKAHKGNVNYDVPAGTDFEKYDHVLVWCEPFSVIFGYAELS